MISIFRDMMIIINSYLKSRV